MTMIFLIIALASLIIPVLELLAIWLFFRRYERRIEARRRLDIAGEAQ